MPNYIDSLNTLIEANAKDHKLSTLEEHLLNAVKDCCVNLKGKEVNQDIGEATSKFETAINHIWKLLYLIPMITLEDTPDKWVIVEDSPLFGKNFKTSNSTYVRVDMLERHIDTIDGAPGCIYRINANTKLAFMLYGNTVIEYDTKDGENLNIKNQYSCACFIKNFPFQVPYPTVTTIIHVKSDTMEEPETYGFISDIRNISREEVSAEELKGHFFTPSGTSMFPNLSIEELNAINSKVEEMK